MKVKHEKPKDLQSFIREIRPLVWKYVRKYYSPWIDKEDIVDECLTVVLTKALKKFKKTKGATFKTFFVWQMRSHLANKQKYYNAKKRQAEIVSLEDVSKYVNVNARKVNLQNYVYGINSFEE